jgi:hypothetical protein
MSTITVTPAFSSYDAYLAYCRDTPGPSQYYVDLSTPFGGGGTHGAQRDRHLEQCLQGIRERFGVKTILLVERGPQTWPLVRYLGGFPSLVNMLVSEFGLDFKEILGRLRVVC